MDFDIILTRKVYPTNFMPLSLITFADFWALGCRSPNTHVAPPLRNRNRSTIYYSLLLFALTDEALTLSLIPIHDDTRQ